MSATNPNVNPSNIVLSPQQVFANGVDLGFTEGGVTISPKYKLAEIKGDATGSTILDMILSGQDFTAKFILAETKAKS
jgi:hypothetical protein